MKICQKSKKTWARSTAKLELLSHQIWHHLPLFRKWVPSSNLSIITLLSFKLKLLNRMYEKMRKSIDDLWGLLYLQVNSILNLFKTESPNECRLTNELIQVFSTILSKLQKWPVSQLQTLMYQAFISSMMILEQETNSLIQMMRRKK